MINFSVNKQVFKFQYLPDYASWLLAYKLEEFVTVGIRFSREIDLPLLKPLSKFSEKELVALSLDSNKLILEALIKNDISKHIEQNTKNWISNSLGVIDKDDVVAEDLTLVFYLRRMNFAYFLDAYTKNIVLQKFIIKELDQYTTQEELILYNVYLKMQQLKINEINAEAELNRELLIEAQELGGMGSYLVNFRDETKSVYTPEYKRILELDEKATFEDFIKNVHPDDQPRLKAMNELPYKETGKYEIEYRYKKSSEKRIWSKGFMITENGSPVIVRGVVKEVG